MKVGFHQHYLACVEEIEQRFPVADWRCGDLEIWPIARMDLYLDMYWQNAGTTALAIGRVRRALQHACVPATNIWRRRNDLRHHRQWPRKADAIFLGDGVSLDCIDGAWQDRYSEPLIATIEKKGRPCFLMQPGDLRHMPWHRDTFPANTVDAVGHALAPFCGRSIAVQALPEVQAFLDRNGIAAPSFSQSRLSWRANIVRATATVFERVLDKVQPRTAFVTTWYAGLAPAFLLACRRRGILSVDLQHCPQGGRHKAYTWRALPQTGYKCLPAIFWTWTAEEAAHTQSWARSSRWHRAVHGGHPRLAARSHNNGPSVADWDERFAQSGVGGCYDRDILVALQTVQGTQDVWRQLAEEIADSPPSWRWWIRRHPAAREADDQMYAELLALRRPNIRIEEASRLPLWVLLPRMSAVVSFCSGVTAEAVAAGVPALFLGADATGPFGDLIESQQASVCDVHALPSAIANLPARSTPVFPNAPRMQDTLGMLDGMASDYARMCRSQKQTHRPPNELCGAIGGRA
ncbi:MAG: hypothetical protein JO056_05560 [Alphaproteobacteria bacterium]|nr:hypothetical protein [Alphaproteobacteria bacterium]